jgi:hypothetical protein
MLSQYGGGRGKETWAERIGKKYQWIALYRLMAHAADNLTKERYMGDDNPESLPGLQALHERNLDPTVVLQREGEDSPEWRIPIEYGFQRTELLSDSEWLEDFDFPDSSEALRIRSAGEPRRSWLLLSGNVTWRSKVANPEPEYPYRTVSMVVRSYLVHNTDKQKCWGWLRKQNFSGIHMPDGYRMHGGFLAEYPYAIPFSSYFENEDDERADPGIPCTLKPTAHFLNIHSEYDAYHPNPINALVPAKEFFDAGLLRWDGGQMYLADSGDPKFVTLPLTGDGPTILVGEADYLSDFMDKHSLTLVWALRMEKNCFERFLGSHNLGYTDYARAHMLKDGEIIHSTPLVKRVKPAKHVE